MNILKKTQTALACLLSLTMLVGMSAFAVSADEAEFEGTKYEAENVKNDENPDGIFVLGGTASVVADGLGEDVSGGAWIGNVGQGEANFLEFTVSSSAAGACQLQIAYNTAGARTIDISVNGLAPINVATPASSGSWTSGVATVIAEVELFNGENTIRLYNAADWAPNVDYVVIGEVDEEAATAAVAALVADAEALPESVDDDNAADFEYVAAKYAGLNDEQKGTLTDAQVTAIEAAVEKLDAYNAAFEQLEADRQKASAVTAQIISIGTVTAEKKETIEAARAAYDALTEDQKALISAGTLNALVGAEEALAELENNPASDPADTTTAPAATDSNADGGDNSTTIIIVAVIAVVVVAAAIVLVVVLRKKK